MKTQATASPSKPPAASWIFTEHTYASVSNLTIEAAINDLTSNSDDQGIAAAKRIAESFGDDIRPGERLSHVALAAIIFARRVMIDLTDSMADIDAETQAIEARAFGNCKKSKAI